MQIVLLKNIMHNASEALTKQKQSSESSPMQSH